MSDADQIHIFDRALLRRRRDRAAGGFAAHRVLFDEAGAGLAERAGDVTRRFERVLDLGAHDGWLARALAADGRFVVASDISVAMAGGFAGPAVIADEELLPFAAGAFDLVVSNLSLHHVNDLPGTLAQIKQCLKPGGLFLAALLGGRTLYELRGCLMEAELAVSGGVSPRISPTLDLPTATALLQRAGFSLPVTDHEMITLTYADMFALMRELRGMGESNIQRHRGRAFTQRHLLNEAARLYQDRHRSADGGVTATFEVIFLHGWREENQ